MMKIAIAASAVLLAMSSTAFSQATSTTVTETTTTTTEIPTEVRTYITEQSNPSVTLEGEIIIGEPLPETVEVYTIPDNDEYGYAIVNDRRVVLNPQTRSVVQIIE